MRRTSASASALPANAVCPSCHRNSRERMNGVGCLNSQRTTLHHWLIFMGRSRCERIQLAMTGYITVSEVGLTAMGTSSSLCPLLVTHATSGAKSSMWSFSASSRAADTNRGK